MNIYSAIMKAADTIEQRPELWRWKNVYVPDCGTPACALGWIGFHLGIAAGKGIYELEGKLGIESSSQFYDRVVALHTGGGWWRDTPETIARNLRRYAEKYHAPEKPAITGIPESVRQIFTTVQA